MSQKLTVSDLQSSRIPAALNICPTDDRFYAWANEAEEMMLNQGRWIGSVMESQFCVSDACLTFPRQVADIRRLAICGYPTEVQGSWYQFTRLVTDLKQYSGCSDGTCATSCNTSCGCGSLELRMKAGTSCSFATTIGSNKLIRAYPLSGADVGKRILFQGRDSNGIWVRTVIDGVMSDGEQVLLSQPFVQTGTTWGPGSPVAVQKDVTSARVLVYEYDTVTTLERALAEYEPSETRPSYRVGYIPGFTGSGGCCCSDITATTKTITALVKLQHVPLASPGDWLILQNLSAYKAAMVAVKAREEKDYATFNFEFYGTQASGKNARGVTRVVNRGGAIPLLQAELRTMTGDRTSAAIYLDESDRFAREMIGFR